MFRLLVVVIEDSVSFIGEYVFTHTVGPLIDSYTNHYQFQFYWWAQWPGQWNYDLFRLDARNVRNPEIYDGHADFFLAGDLIYGEDGCMLEDNDIHFAVEEDRADSQIVMSDSAASCWMNQFAQSRIGKIIIDD